MTRRRTTNRKNDFLAAIAEMPLVQRVDVPGIPPKRRRRSNEADVLCAVYLDQALHARLDAFCKRSHCWSMPWAVIQMIEHCLDEAGA